MNKLSRDGCHTRPRPDGVIGARRAEGRCGCKEGDFVMSKYGGVWSALCSLVLAAVPLVALIYAAAVSAAQA